jgi:hypothetical protein
VWQPAADSNVCFAHLFYIFEARQTAIIVYSWLLYLMQQVQIPKKVRQITILICSGLLYPTGWAAQLSKTYYGGFFLRTEKPSEDITLRLFLMKMKGLKGIITKFCLNVL